MHLKKYWRVKLLVICCKHLSVFIVLTFKAPAVIIKCTLITYKERLSSFTSFEFLLTTFHSKAQNLFQKCILLDGSFSIRVLMVYCRSSYLRARGVRKNWYKRGKEKEWIKDAWTGYSPRHWHGEARAQQGLLSSTYQFRCCAFG